MYEKEDALESEWKQYTNEFNTLWDNSRAWDDYILVVKISNNSGIGQSVSAILFDYSKDLSFVSDPIKVYPGEKVYEITVPTYGYNITSTSQGFIINNQSTI